jgi:hypothetical protein
MDGKPLSWQTKFLGNPAAFDRLYPVFWFIVPAKYKTNSSGLASLMLRIETGSIPSCIHVELSAGGA